MRDETRLRFGETPTPEARDAAIRRGRTLQSAAFHIAWRRAGRGMLKAGELLSESLSLHRFTLPRRTPAPNRRSSEASWDLLPRPLRWQTIARDRVL